MRSDQAAAQLISNGQTTDLELAYTISNGLEIDMDKLQRAAIRRELGFDFGIKIDQTAPYILVHSNERPFCHTKVKLFEGDVSERGLLTNEQVLARLFHAIERLKTKYHKIKALEETIVDEED